MRIAQRHGATNVFVFGSRARGDEIDGSDLDLLVDVLPGTTLLDLIRMEEALQALLGIPVDIVTRGGLDRSSREAILREAKQVGVA